MEKDVDSSGLVSESLIHENDSLVVTIFAAGLDGIDQPAFAFVVEREEGAVRKKVGWFASPADDNHQIALVQGLVEGAKSCYQHTTIRIETTSKSFLVESLNNHFPKWKAIGNWPKKTGRFFKEFDEILTANEITLAKSRHITSSPALTFAQEMVKTLREKMQGQRDSLAQGSPY